MLTITWCDIRSYVILYVSDEWNYGHFAYGTHRLLDSSLIGQFAY